MPTIRQTIEHALADDRWTSVTELVHSHYDGEPTDARRVAVRRVVRQMERDGALVTRRGIEEFRETKPLPSRRKRWVWAPCRGEPCTPCYYAVQLDPPGYWTDRMKRGLPEWATDEDRELERQHGSHSWLPRREEPEVIEGSERTRHVPVHALYVANLDYAEAWQAERDAERERLMADVAEAVGLLRGAT